VTAPLVSMVLLPAMYLIWYRGRVLNGTRPVEGHYETAS